MMNYLFKIFITLLIFTSSSIDRSCGQVKNIKIESGAYERTLDCSTVNPNEEDNRFNTFIEPQMMGDRSKGYLGTIGIVGGSPATVHSTYFAALSAMKVGADVVHVFCEESISDLLLYLLPNAFVHGILNNDFDETEQLLKGTDVIVVCQGLALNYISLTNILPRVIDLCKRNEGKPLVLDLSEYFITEGIIKQLSDFPDLGVILTTNNDEFEKLYKLVKTSGSFSDSFISIDYDILGNNVLVHRKGCVDTALSSNVLSSWSLRSGVSQRRTSGQGDVITGAIGTYFHWALNMYSRNTEKGSTYPASFAAYSASKLIRLASNIAYDELTESMVTTNILDTIHKVIVELNV